ncbi:DUF541 domain-containing protein [Salegentibacter sp. BLCTC]|uniref:SIMPL domain-containing protein n=1 Tax=Salegentibacter sp. BLCTC TaxID=2697368 RepID=UPI00187B3236|nr:SIMPL domain-containing protein [Salegentibacter sp. BLCTC]MBE7638768.1 DUF541 domain-containing protein [Salegentibacter sp. BLCTC]
MKNMHLSFILLFTVFIASAQTNPQYIEAAGQTTYQRDVKHYEATIRISNTTTYGNDAELALENRKTIFLQKLDQLGLDRNQVQIGNTAKNEGSENRQHTDYVVETTDENEIEKIQSLGKIDSWSYKLHEKVIYKPLTNKSDIISKALEDANRNAEVIANVIGQKIGKILVVSDYNYEERPDSAFYTKEDRTYRIVVRFTIN